MTVVIIPNDARQEPLFHIEPLDTEKPVFVSSDQYEEYGEGEELTVSTQNGFFGIQWFYVD